MRLDEIELLVSSGRATSFRVGEALAVIEQELETSGATHLLTGIDVCNTQIAVQVVGLFSLFESRVKAMFDLKEPIDEIVTLLQNSGDISLGEQIETLRLVVNVLKHGEGTSHTRLLARAASLSFEVKHSSSDRFEEGNVCPPSDLIVVTLGLLEETCQTIENAWQSLKSQYPIR